MNGSRSLGVTRAWVGRNTSCLFNGKEISSYSCTKIVVAAMAYRLVHTDGQSKYLVSPPCSASTTWLPPSQTWGSVPGTHRRRHPLQLIPRCPGPPAPKMTRNQHLPHLQNVHVGGEIPSTLFPKMQGLNSAASLHNSESCNLSSLIDARAGSTFKTRCTPVTGRAADPTLSVER